ncbi:hypothetical protein C6503_03860 [Candidatus Poribacteria bacterium]|nr:MAG: hypothetical protein C6503_03860 [Candidatus Poribacteria bacterium]
MKRNSLIVSLVGGGIALLCCLLPWIKIDISFLDLDPVISPPKEFLTISGFHIAAGNDNMPYAFFAALVLILVCFRALKTPWIARKPVLICSVIGFLFVLFTLFSFRRELSEGTPLAEKILEYSTSKVELGQIASLQFGGFGAAIGFIVAFIGAWNLPKSDPSTENSE